MLRHVPSKHVLRHVPVRHVLGTCPGMCPSTCLSTCLSTCPKRGNLTVNGTRSRGIIRIRNA